MCTIGSPPTIFYVVGVIQDTESPTETGEGKIEHARWCTRETHHYEVGKCQSPAVEIGEGVAWMWLEQSEQALSPRIIVDASPNGADLTLEDALDLCGALQRLSESASGPVSTSLRKSPGTS